VTDTVSEPSEIDQIATRYWEDVLRLSPTTATVYGDERYNDRLDDPGPAGRAEARQLMERVWREAAAVSPDGLPDEDRITRDILQVVAEAAIEADDLSFHELLAVDQINGPQTLLAQVAQFQPADTPERLEAWLARIRAYGAYIDAHIDIMADGLRSGRTAARIVADRTIEQLRRTQAIPIGEAIVPAMSRVANDADRERVRDVVREVVYPADRRLLDALTGPYHAATREQPGLVSVPDGDTLYRHAIRRWTSLDMEPADVHQVGLDELATINEERRAIAGSEGFGTDIAAYRRKLTIDTTNQAPSPEALVARCNEDIVRAAEVAPTMFGRLPVASCEVRPVEAFKERDAPFAYYFPPSLDLSRPGIYYVNTYDLPSRTFSKLASTTYHEAIPGHHFQISLEMEQAGLNVFRRLGARAAAGAYLEGWGLYAERLADELGLYRSPAERFGMLDAQAWRASRLIVDSGMHALGWKRQQSIDWLLDTGLSETDAVIETDRYIVWPGQALTYMTGMREIRRLRHQLEARDGARFDLRRFHDELIGHGSLPLATLAKELPRWVTPAG
jgi:uncharacterized protein (DUF885 family)